MPCDVTDPSAVEAAFATVEATWGPVEVLVVNAGAGASAPLAETTDEEWQRMLDLNLTAPFRCIRRALPSMIGRRLRPDRRRRIGGRQARRGPDRGVLRQQARRARPGALRRPPRWRRSGVTVNAVCPGYVDTPMTDDGVAAIAARTGKSAAEAREILADRQPIGRLVTPDEVARRSCCCVDNGAVNGQGLNVDGGAVQS